VQRLNNWAVPPLLLALVVPQQVTLMGS